MSSINIVLLHASNLNIVKSYGPQCLYQVDQTTVLSSQIETINQSFKNPNIIIVAGFKYKKIKSHVKDYNNVLVIENTQYEHTNDLYSIYLAMPHLVNNVLIINDNIIFNQTLFNKFKKYQSHLFITNKQTSDIGCILDKHSQINNVSWGLSNYWTNISFFYKNEFEMLKKIANSTKTSKWFLMEAINNIIKHDGIFLGKEINTKIKIIDKMNV